MPLHQYHFFYIFTSSKMSEFTYETTYSDTESDTNNPVEAYHVSIIIITVF